MDNDVAAFKAHLDAISATLATKADIQMLRTDMRKMSAVGRRWMVASLVGMFIGFVGLYFVTVNSLLVRPIVAPRSQAPIIVIYLPQSQLESSKPRRAD